MENIICRIKPYIQPFEKKLALDELAQLSGNIPRTIEYSDDRSQYDDRAQYYEVKSQLTSHHLADHLTYWECIVKTKPIYTAQVLYEATANVARNGIPTLQIASQLPFGVDVPLPNTRCLRYGTHGIHEYRGKFFPQLVKSLINISGATSKSTIADPMCGSGTTLVEAVLSGCTALGMDYNPLSSIMTQTKCDILFVKPDILEKYYCHIKDDLTSNVTQSANRSTVYFDSLPKKDQNYLVRWFANEDLIELDIIAQSLNSIDHKVVRQYMWLILSNVLRTISWQKTDDLRVRKEAYTKDYIKPIVVFLEELERSLRYVLAFLYQNSKRNLGVYKIDNGDARELNKFWARSSVDAIITSPPYATALPYLDTDRLSLIYLGLLSRPNHRQKDYGMIGNREISNNLRDAYWARFQETKAKLPSPIISLIEKIHQTNINSDVGFRRRNLGPLLSKYFFDMQKVLSNIKYSLKAGGKAYVVVGNNHTFAGGPDGERIEIPTAEFLSDLAETVGLQACEHIPMEMLISRDIFKRNAVASEYILIFDAPA